ncbi:MAG: winged helix-turn-helix domain-containing protein [Cenarchaeum sp. SB0662_bin_33]|nr:winged helix-turn-helix domain-containing protein [Cenarchaeum sp. SB0662_bin_33]
MLLRQQPNYTCPEAGASNGTNVIKKCMAGLKNRSRSGRPPKIDHGIMKKIRRETQYWTAEEMHDHIFKLTNVSFSISYIRRIMKSWGYTMKVPVRIHVKRASRRCIKKF